MTTTTATAFLSAPTTSHGFSVPKQRLYFISSNRWSSFNFQTSLTKSSSNFIRSSSQTSTSVAEEEGGSPSSDDLLAQSESTAFLDSDSLPPLRGCKACGREEIENGCNGEGRIQGGIATVPGFGWWPIKAYRPCPGLVASGGRYTRRGQSMDEVAGFGKVRRGTSMGTNDEAQSSKKKQGPRK